MKRIWDRASSVCVQAEEGDVATSLCEEVSATNHDHRDVVLSESVDGFCVRLQSCGDGNDWNAALLA